MRKWNGPGGGEGCQSDQGNRLGTKIKIGGIWERGQVQNPSVKHVCCVQGIAWPEWASREA